MSGSGLPWPWGPTPPPRGLEPWWLLPWGRERAVARSPSASACTPQETASHTLLLPALTAQKTGRKLFRRDGTPPRPRAPRSSGYRGRSLDRAVAGCPARGVPPDTQSRPGKRASSLVQQTATSVHSHREEYMCPLPRGRAYDRGGQRRGSRANRQFPLTCASLSPWRTGAGAPPSCRLGTRAENSGLPHPQSLGLRTEANT